MMMIGLTLLAWLVLAQSATSIAPQQPPPQTSSQIARGSPLPSRHSNEYAQQQGGDMESPTKPKTKGSWGNHWETFKSAVNKAKEIAWSEEFQDFSTSARSLISEATNGAIDLDMQVRTCAAFQ